MNNDDKFDIPQSTVMVKHGLYMHLTWINTLKKTFPWTFASASYLWQLAKFKWIAITQCMLNEKSCNADGLVVALSNEMNASLQTIYG